MAVIRETPGARNRFDGGDLRAMFAVATRLFERSVDTVNALNVFPVPDGDTGTNMFLTLRDIVAAAEDVESEAAHDVASAMARGALLGARGNSGVILSQFFKGIALGLQGHADFGPKELAQALQSSREHAYKAVGEPVEGTLLTVISSVAASARESADAGDSLQDLLDAICDAATDTVALTPTMLSVLRDAGVVDAGGHGLSVILEGVRAYSSGREVGTVEVAPPAPVGVGEQVGIVTERFLETTEEELYGYCTQFLIEATDGLSTEAVREEMASLAQSTVVVGDESMIKVHVHARDPGPVISYAVSLGTLSQVKIDNMDEQHVEYSVARRREAGPEATKAAASLAVVAVAWGRGVEKVLADLGASGILPGGDTMNPSIQEILDAVEAAPSENVIFLPNNRNIVPAANQAVELSEKQLRVVPSTTIPQGIAAMLAFNPERGLDDTVSDMSRILSSVRTGEVCNAVRAVQLNGVPVREGQLIGLLERKLVVAGDEPIEVMLSLLREADVSEGDLVTLYWGGPLTPDGADSAHRRVAERFPGAEVELVEGGQPHYHFILSIE